MDPVLGLRSNWAPPSSLFDPATELPTEEFELLLRIIRFVWTFATGMGVVGRDLSAVAAAAAESEAVDV